MDQDLLFPLRERLSIPYSMFMFLSEGDKQRDDFHVQPRVIQGRSLPPQQAGRIDRSISVRPESEHVLSQESLQWSESWQRQYFTLSAISVDYSVSDDVASTRQDNSDCLVGEQISWQTSRKESRNSLFISQIHLVNMSLWKANLRNLSPIFTTWQVS